MEEDKGFYSVEYNIGRVVFIIVRRSSLTLESVDCAEIVYCVPRA